MPDPMPPAGDVTLMFTDIEGSTRGWDTYPHHFGEALRRHDVLVRAALSRHKGYEVKTIGDSFFATFSDPLSAALCAIDVQRSLEADGFSEVGGIRVRIGLHTGQIEPVGGDYFGPVVNRAARVMDAGHGGMILLSEETSSYIAAELPSSVTLELLGVYKLKDLGVPQRIFRLDTPDLPRRDYGPLRTLDVLPHNFPAQVTSFVGRDREIKGLRSLLFEERARIVTLTGPGGAGKTRLAMQVAVDNCQRFPDGAWLVELASVSDPGDVPAAIANALRDSLPPDVEQEAMPQITTFLRDRRSLLVLDNFEQVVDAARVLSELVRNCRHLTCLVTSRQLLSISGEREFPVEPLAIPPTNAEADDALGYDCVRLFVERGRAARPGFVLSPETTPAVVEICRRLDGIPLAVELTAGLVRGMSPQDILPRLRNRFRLLASQRRDLDPRQRSLRGAIDWSYDLLTEDERALFARLSVFAGGFTIEDAEAVCDAPDAFLLVLNLRDKSLVRASESGTTGETRFAMLETLREYAQEKLATSGEWEALRNAHARHFLTRATELSDQLMEGDAQNAITRMSLDLDNFQLGRAWAEAQNDHALLVDYSLALARYFQRRGPKGEAERALRALEQAEAAERALAEAEDEDEARDDESHTARLTRLLLRQGTLHYKRGDNDAARPKLEEAMARARRWGEGESAARILSMLGVLAWATCRYEDADANWSEALAIARRHSLTRREGDLLANLAMLAALRGRHQSARDYFAQAEGLLERTGDQEGMAYALLNHGNLLVMQYDEEQGRGSADENADLIRARSKLEASLKLFRKMGNIEGVCHATNRLGMISLLEGDTQEAERLCREALAVAEESGDQRGFIAARRDLGRIAVYRLRQNLPSDISRVYARAAHEHLSAALNAAVEMKEDSEVTDVLRRAGELAALEGQPQLALLAYTVAFRERERLKLAASRALLMHMVEAKSQLSEHECGAIQDQADKLSPAVAAEQIFHGLTPS